LAAVEVRLFATLRRETGVRSLCLDSADLDGVVRVLGSRYGAGLLHQLERATFLVNGRNAAQLMGLRTELRDGDVISIFPPLAGG